ncbi:unnamed protein product, partial [Polarella glacialis]
AKEAMKTATAANANGKLGACQDQGIKGSLGGGRLANGSLPVEPAATGGDTPETGTPLTRSLSPSSDGGTSVGAAHSERGGSGRARGKKSAPLAEAVVKTSGVATSGVAAVVPVADNEAPDREADSNTEGSRAVEPSTPSARSEEDAEAEVKATAASSRRAG